MKNVRELLKMDDDMLNAIARTASGIKREIAVRKEMREFNKKVIESLLDITSIGFLKGNGLNVVKWAVFEGVKDFNGNMLNEDDDYPEDVIVVESLWEINFSTFDVKVEVDNLYYEHCQLNARALNYLLGSIEQLVFVTDL